MALLPDAADVDSVVQHARNPDMARTYWLPGRPAVTTAAAQALVEELMRGWDAYGEHGAALFVRQRHELVGAVYLRKGAALVELGYGVAPEFRNHGVATRATRVAMDWLTRTGEGQRFAIGTDPDNRASCRVADKLGFKATRVDRKTTKAGKEYLETLYVWRAPDDEGA